MSMQEGKDRRRDDDGERVGRAEGESRPQRAGEAATTRFGMEKGDNTDISTSGGPASDEEE